MKSALRPGLIRTASLRSYLVIPLLLSSAAAFPQSYREKARQYELQREQNKVSEQRIHQQYLNNLPNAPGGSSGGTTGNWLEQRRQSEREIQAWLDSRNTPKPAVVQMTEAQKRLYFADKAYEAARIAELREKGGPIAADLEKGGFKRHEAFQMARYVLQSQDDITYKARLAEIYLATKSFATYNLQRKTAAYENQISWIWDFRLSGLTAMDALTALERQFPDRKTEIDLVAIKTFGGLYKFPTWLIPEEVVPPEEKLRAGRLLIELFQGYPLETLKMSTDAPVNPMAQPEFTNWIVDKKDRAAKAGIFMYLLQTPDDHKPDVTPTNYLTSGYESALRQLYPCQVFFRENKNMDYVRDLSPADWMRISKAKGIPATDIMVYLAGEGQTISSKHNYSRNEGGWYSRKIKFMAFGFEAMVRRLAESGDADAMNAFAVQIATRIENRLPLTEVMPWLMKSADAGSFMGNLNLFLAKDWGLPDYNSPENLRAVNLQLRKHFMNSSPRDMYLAAYYISGANWKSCVDSKDEIRKTAVALIKLAAEKGEPGAVEVLNRYPEIRKL